MNTILLLLTLPFLHSNNQGEVKNLSNSQEVIVLFTMENCPPCEMMKVELTGRANTYQLKNTDKMFYGFTKGCIRSFPAIGVWHKSRLTIYQGADKIRSIIRRK